MVSIFQAYQCTCRHDVYMGTRSQAMGQAAEMTCRLHMPLSLIVCLLLTHLL